MVKYYYSKYNAVESLYPAYTAQSIIRLNPDGTGNKRIDSELIKLGMDIQLGHPMHKTSISVVESQRRLWIKHDYNDLTLGYSLEYLLKTYGPGEHYYFQVGYDPKFYSIYPTTDYECTLYEWKVGSSYFRGSLIQSDIQAENNTYPTDGYWYVRGSQVPLAPTQPGAFTQPSGTLEIGDSKVFSVGASSDENGNLSKYIWEVSINSAAYSKAGETKTNSFTYTIPTATSLKMRVKAVDSGGLESAYRESSSYTVTPAKYYWSKYNVFTTPSKDENYIPEYISGPTLKTFGSIADYKSARGSIDGAFTEISVKGNSIDGFVVLRSGYFNINSLAPNTSFTVYTQLNSKYLIEVSSTRIVTETDYGYFKIKGTGVYGPPSISKGTLISSNIVAEYNTYTNDAKNVDGYWYVRGSRVNQSIAPPSPFTDPVSGKKFKPGENVNITFGSSNAPNLSLYEVDYRYNSTGTWTPLAYINTLTRSLTVTNDKTLKTLELRVRAKNSNNVHSDYVYSEAFTIEHNVAPAVSLTSPTENITLYENDILNIAGTAYDADPDQAVTAYYQINSEPRKVLATNLSQKQIPLSKQLKFNGGKLYDGETVITESLADGVTHKLKVWAEDSEKVSSTIVEKAFYVVPNRAPLLSVDTIVPSGVIDNDKFKISGKVSDEDANSTLKVTRRINNRNAVEIYDDVRGEWEFDVSLAQLQVGKNTIVVEVVDNYGAKTSKTIKLNKNEVKTPILQSVARYKIEPPKGTAKGVLLFIERDKELELKVELSMTLAGKQEQYETLTPEDTAPMSYDDNIVEDTFYYETTEPKENIVLKLSTTRPNETVIHKIHLISGAVE